MLLNPSALVRLLSLTLGTLLAFGLVASSAMAGCDVIPGALNAFPAAVGETNTPYAVPGQLVQVRVRPAVCDQESDGLAGGGASGCVDPANLRVSFLFFDQSLSRTGPSAVVLADSCAEGSWGASGAQALSGTCVKAEAGDLEVVSVDVVGSPECRLNLRMPETQFSGPARIFVDRDGAALPSGVATTRCAGLGEPGVACIDELYKLNGTCDTAASNQREVFSHFVALPPANDYAAMIGIAAPPVRFALDGRGNILAPVDWSGVLFEGGEAESFPPPQLVNFFATIGSGFDASGAPAAPGEALEVIESAALSSWSPFGLKLPPLLEPSSDESQVVTLFGTTDAQLSIIRVQSSAGRCLDDSSKACITDASCATGSCDTSSPQPAFDLSYCVSEEGCVDPEVEVSFTPVPSGPGVILSYQAEIDGFVPLENLNVCRTVTDVNCVLRDESLPVRFGVAPQAGEQFCAPGQPGSGPICTDRNGDDDILDTVLTLRNTLSGQQLALVGAAGDGVSVTSIHEIVSPVGPVPFSPAGRSSRKAVAAGPNALGDACVATLVAEPDEGGADLNQDQESFDPVLRVYCPGDPGEMVHTATRGGSEVVELAVLPEPSVLGSGRTLSLSKLQPGLEPLVMEGGRAVFLLDEPGNAEHDFERADVEDVGLGGAASDGIAASPAIDESGEVVCFQSTGQLVDSRDKNKAGFDVFCHDFTTGETFVGNRFQEPPRRRALCDGRIIRANGDAGPPSVAGAGERVRVCYDSPATNLAKGDQNKARDIFLLDRCSCETLLVSVADDGSQLSSDSGECALAAGGDFAVFTNGGDVYTQGIAGTPPGECGVGPVEGGELSTTGLSRVSTTGNASAPTTSRDGGVVAFQVGQGASASVLIAADGGDPACLDADGTAGCDVARSPQLSADGRLLTYEAFDTEAGVEGVFVLDRVTGLAEAVGSVASSSSGGEAVSGAVAYTRDSGPDVVVRDRVTLLSKFVDPQVGSSQAALSEDGRTVAYVSGDGVYRSTPDPTDADAILAGSRADEAVLAVVDLQSGELEIVGPAVQAAVSGSTLAHIDPSGRVFVNGVGPLTLLGGGEAVASAVAVSDQTLCVIHEDSFVWCGTPGAALEPLGVQGEGLGIAGDLIAVLTLPASPRDLLVYKAGDPNPIAQVTGVRRFRLSSNRWVAADQCESFDSNDPGADICFAVLIDPDGNTYPVTGTDGTLSTVVPCTGDVCDDTDPFKLFPFGDGDPAESARLRYLSREDQQGADLNFDMDEVDVVVREFVPDVIFGFAISVSEGSTGNVLAGIESQSGAAIPAQVGFCRTSASGLVPDTSIACQSDQDCEQQGVCGGADCCADIQSRVLALVDSDGDGVFDVFDNCPTVYNPEQRGEDGDGDGVPDTCDDSSCGDGVVQNLEYCDYADTTIDPITGQTLGSFCNAPSDVGEDCTPLVGVEVSESAVNPDKNGVLPTTVFGSPVLNLGMTAFGDRPPQMLEPGSIGLEPLKASEACGGPGAMSTDDLTDPGTYQTRLSDRNGDGFLDLGLRFQVSEMGVDLADTEACLTGSFRVVADRFFEADFETRDDLNVK